MNSSRIGAANTSRYQVEGSLILQDDETRCKSPVFTHSVSTSDQRTFRRWRSRILLEKVKHVCPICGVKEVVEVYIVLFWPVLFRKESLVGGFGGDFSLLSNHNSWGRLSCVAELSPELNMCRPRSLRVRPRLAKLEVRASMRTYDNASLIPRPSTVQLYYMASV